MQTKSLSKTVTKRVARRTCVTLFLMGAVTLPTMAQQPIEAYPNRPVRMVVSYAAGNVTDTLARIISENLAAKWGQSVIVDNKAGQGGSLGAQVASNASPDGYTLLFSAVAAMAINPHLYSKVGYDPLKDFVPIINVASPEGVMVIPPTLKINSLSELVAYSKANPTAINYGTAGNGTVPHLNTEMLKGMTGLVAQHIPYKSASAVKTDVMGGRLQLQSDAIAVALPQIKTGKLIAIASISSERLPQLPDVPAIGELVSGYEPVVPWLGIFALAGTPPEVIARVNTDVAAILKQPDVKEKFDAFGLSVSGAGPEVFGKTLVRDYARLGKLVKQLNLKVD